MSFLCHNDVIMGSNWEYGVIMSELNVKTFFWDLGKIRVGKEVDKQNKQEIQEINIQRIAEYYTLVYLMFSVFAVSVRIIRISYIIVLCIA